MTQTFQSTSWLTQRACNGADPAVFYGRSTQARKLCASCPVQAECLEQCLAEEVVPAEVFGYRGGKTCTERKTILKGRRRNRQSECGTDRGYDRHRREHSPFCDRCREAHAAAERERTIAARPVVETDGAMIHNDTILRSEAIDLDILDTVWAPYGER